jgi:hypothetical protein
MGKVRKKGEGNLSKITETGKGEGLIKGGGKRNTDHLS